MKDPVCGMEGKWSAHGAVFCSIYCLRKYEELNHLLAIEPEPIKKTIPFSSIAAYILLIAGSILFILSFFIVPLKPFKNSLIQYASMVSLPFFTGLALASFIDVFVPREIISRLMAQGNARDTVRAAFLGFAASTCSHGCLAISMELHKKGASGPSVLAFLLASPWASFPITLLLVQLFGMKGFAIIGFAFVIAVATGLMAQKLIDLGILSANPNTVKISPNSLQTLLRQSWNENKKISIFFPKFLSASRSLTAMTLPWILMGLFLAALVSAYLSMAIGPYLGKGVGGPPLAMGLASILEVCSEGSAPLAFGIYTAGGSALGSAFAFLEAGVVTDFNEISLVWANLGKKYAWALVLLALPQVLFWSYILNFLF